MNDFDKLELLLRRHGFLAGVMTDEDRKCTEALLADLPQGESQALYDARESFLNLIADGSIKEEPDGDETGDHTQYIIQTHWRQLGELCDALGLPSPRYAETVGGMLDRALATDKGDRPDKLPLPTKCEGCDEAATLCETCAGDRFTERDPA